MSKLEEENIKSANKNLSKGLDCLKTSVVKFRFKPDYLSAIPYFKKAAEIFHGCCKFEEEINTRKKLIDCFNETKSFWEGGNEYEKIFKVQLNQLNKSNEAYESLINSYESYIKNKDYQDGIKFVSKSSDELFEKKEIELSKKSLELAFSGINKFYHLLTLNDEDNRFYIYECIDKYINVLTELNEYETIIEKCECLVELIKNNKEDDKKEIVKYYGAQAIFYYLLKNEDEYKKCIGNGEMVEIEDDNICAKIDKLLGLIKNNSNNSNKRKIKNLFDDLSEVYPLSMTKLINKVIKDSKNSASVEDNKKNNTINSFEDEDLK